MRQEDKTWQGERMYSDWSSFCLLVRSDHAPDRSVLSTLPLSADGAKHIVTIVVQPIAANIGLSLASPVSRINSDKEVNWCMEASPSLSTSYACFF